MKSESRRQCALKVLFAMAWCAQATHVHAEDTVDSERAANLVILDQTAVRNLRLETEMADERAFETTAFAVGRIEEIPARRYSISSRIPGRAVAIEAFEGDVVKKGQVLVKVESRQPGDPPPTIELTAIQDGLVVSSHVLIGQPVDPATDLLDIADRTQMWAIAKIPEQDAAGIGPGTKARIVVPALGNGVIEAVMMRYGVTADREAGTVEGVFQLSNAEGRLLPGMRAEFAIILSQRENVLAVPREAVQGDPARRTVYVKDFELPYAFIRAPVVLGEENDRYVEVISGLFPGDDVVTRGAYSLGFVGSGSGMSLKDALDAAHGHEHGEDGSELSASDTENDAPHGEHDHGAHGQGGALSHVLRVYAIGITLLALVFAQRLFHRNQKPDAA